MTQTTFPTRTKMSGPENEPKISLIYDLLNERSRGDPFHVNNGAQLRYHGSPDYFLSFTVIMAHSWGTRAPNRARILTTGLETAMAPAGGSSWMHADVRISDGGFDEVGVDQVTGGRVCMKCSLGVAQVLDDGVEK